MRAGSIRAWSPWLSNSRVVTLLVGCASTDMGYTTVACLTSICPASIQREGFSPKEWAPEGACKPPTATPPERKGTTNYLEWQTRTWATISVEFSCWLRLVLRFINPMAHLCFPTYIRLCLRL
jgi:hypothetical protein